MWQSNYSVTLSCAPEARPARAGDAVRRPLRSAVSSLAAVVAGVVLAAQPVGALAEDITLGVIAGITGLGASYGRGIVQGAEMAVRDVNAAGGIDGRKLKLLVADGASQPARSTLAMRRLVAADVALVVGGWGSPQVLANLDVAEQAGIPYIVVGATHPGITSKKNRWTFRVIQTDSVMADQLAGISLGWLAATRIAVFNDSNDYGAANRDVFIAALARRGVSPVEIQSYQTADRNFTSQLQRLRAANPDSIALFGTVPAAPEIMKQARELGIKARFLGTGGLANEALISSAPLASAGTILMTHFSEEVDAEAQAWADRYRREFTRRHEVPRPVLAAWEYRAIRYIAAPCLQRAGPDRDRLRECIAAWRGKLPGVANEAHFDEAGQLVQPPLAVEVRDGAFRLFRTAP